MLLCLFFAYGLFKPGQLAFHKIQDLVKDSLDAKVVGKLKDRDGIPIYVNEGNNHVKGALIFFLIMVLRLKLIEELANLNQVVIITGKKLQQINK